MNDGFEILKRTHQDSSLCSVIFDPVALAAYLCFHMRFDKIWRLDLQQNSIETYSGFSCYQKFTLDESGIENEIFEQVS